MSKKFGKAGHREAQRRFSGKPTAEKRRPPAQEPPRTPDGANGAAEALRRFGTRTVEETR